ncbi:serine protease inhibitor Cvsi-2-like [Mizuhopecten yessoensis]|uniref:serine protease inhibitor Cvsi-2-like n=1 Tax=Mizuhopecten yessoensis TaxID=6573 RepID=UPI000B459CE1|nr:serine protease inhibitor Cvsi-2-like [Mizuhopecten yessoensis]
MRFVILTVSLAALFVYAVSEHCHEHDDLDATCILTSCNGNNTIMVCAHDECTCAINPNVPCLQKSDCEQLSGCVEHHRKPGKQWHCLDSACKCF